MVSWSISQQHTHKHTWAAGQTDVFKKANRAPDWPPKVGGNVRFWFFEREKGILQELPT